MLGLSLKTVWLVLLAATVFAEVTKSGSDTLKIQNKTADVQLINPNKTAKSLHVPSNYQEVNNFTNLVRLADILDIFNIADVAREWNAHEHQFNMNCSKHMKEYFNGLQRGNLWAVKSE